MNYKWLKLAQLVRRNADGACIPNDPANIDWQRFQAEGGQADPEDPPPAPPSQNDLEAGCIAGTSAPPAPQYGFDLQRAFIAHVISCEAYRLGVAPGALSGAQLSAIRARVAAIYKAL